VGRPVLQDLEHITADHTQTKLQTQLQAHTHMIHTKIVCNNVYTYAHIYVCEDMYIHSVHMRTTIVGGFNITDMHMYNMTIIDVGHALQEALDRYKTFMHSTEN